MSDDWIRQSVREMVEGFPAASPGLRERVRPHEDNGVRARRGWVMSVVAGALAVAVVAMVGVGVQLRNQRGAAINPTFQGQSGPGVVSFGSPSPGVVWVLDRAGLYISQDGASTWRSISPPGLANPLDIKGAAFIDSRRGWVVGYDPVAGHVMAERTGDGGKSWSGVSLPTQPPSSASVEDAYIDPVDSSNLWLGVGAREGADMTTHVATGGYWVDLFTSHDGGRSWQAVADSIPPDAGVSFLPRSSSGWGASQGGALYHTVDGGQKWERAEIPGLGFFAEFVYDPPRIAGRTVFVVVRGRAGNSVEGRVQVARTSDDGASWSLETAPKSTATYAYQSGIMPFDVVSGRTPVLFSGPEQGFGATELDFGAEDGTWTVLHPQFPPPRSGAMIDGVFVGPQLVEVAEIHFNSVTDGWAALDLGGCIDPGFIVQSRTRSYCGQRSALIHTTDGGRTWTAIAPPSGRS